MFAASAGAGRRNRKRTLTAVAFLQELAKRMRAELFARAGEPRNTGGTPGTRTDDCIFCRRHDPELNRIMCENDTFFARYDNYPSAPGHVEIVPKRHIESFFDLDDKELADSYSLLLLARRTLVEEYDPPHGYTIGVNEGRAAGRSVDHLHIHLIPRYFGDVDDPRGGIRKATPNWDPDNWK